jgi:hypothetical protein
MVRRLVYDLTGDKSFEATTQTIVTTYKRSRNGFDRLTRLYVSIESCHVRRSHTR